MNETLHKHRSKVLATCGLSRLTWYQATRHTFASQWVLGGGWIEKLKELMGHSSAMVTERYAHLTPDLFRSRDFEMLAVDLLAESGDVVPLTAGNGRNGCSESFGDYRRFIGEHGTIVITCKKLLRPGSSVGRAED